jgi:23S rRNA pseudouridine1911/1915/1917 synthase
MDKFQEIEILFEDNHLFVANKPGGLLTQPSGTSSNSLEDLVKKSIKKNNRKEGNVYLGIVHRLDKPVSGVVLFAKTSKALSRLNTAIRAKHFQKTYYALIEGTLSNNEGILEHFLQHNDFHASISDSKHPDAKLSRLHYRVIKYHNQTTLIEVVLETGRYHQIRAQFSAIGHPIVGDTKYGSRIEFFEGRIALHHFRLQAPHPITQAVMIFEAPLPNIFKLSP